MEVPSQEGEEPVLSGPSTSSIWRPRSQIHWSSLSRIKFGEGYRKVMAALDVQQQSIFRKCGPFFQACHLKKQQQARQGQSHILCHVFGYQYCKIEKEER